MGFKRSRRDPPLLVGSVLGLVGLELDRLLRDIETKQKQMEQCKERIPELERMPVYALAHAERQLRLRVKAQENEPVFMTTVGDSIESRVQSLLELAEQSEQRLESDAEKMEEALAGELVRLHELTKARDLAKLEADIAKSLVDVNRADFERLTELRDRLEGLNRPLKKCFSNASGTLSAKTRAAQTRLRSDCNGPSGRFAGPPAHFGRTYPWAHA